MNKKDQAIIREAMRILGSRTSARKAKTSRENAAKARDKKKIKKQVDTL
jgi:hypothetical protein